MTGSTAETTTAELLAAARRLQRSQSPQAAPLLRQAVDTAPKAVAPNAAPRDAAPRLTQQTGDPSCEAGYAALVLYEKDSRDERHWSVHGTESHDDYLEIAEGLVVMLAEGSPAPSATGL